MARRMQLGQLNWRKSLASGSTNCVEVAFAADGDTVFMRDSKAPQQDPLCFTRSEWDAFVAGVRRGDFDGE